MTALRKLRKKPPKMLDSLWVLMTNPQLGVALLSAVTVFVMMWLLGWTDIFESVGFIFVLAMLAANLLCFCVELWSEPDHLEPIETPALESARASARKSRCLYFTANLGSSARNEEAFSAWLRGWSRLSGRRIRKLDAGEGVLQFHVAAGIRRSALIAGYHAAVLILVVGGLATFLAGRQATVVVHEGARSRGFDRVREGLMHGSIGAWAPYQERGHLLQGRVHPGFDLEVREISGTRARILLLDGQVGGSPSQAREIAFGEPVSWEDLTIHLTEVSRTGRAFVGLEVTDQVTGRKDALSALQQGAQVSRDGYQFRIVGIQDGIEGAGTAVQIQYQEKGRQPETFWVFQEFPDSDLVMRKRSRFVFRLESLRPIYQARFIVSNDPGAKAVFFGAALFIVFFVASLALPRERFWFVWDKGKVWVVGAADEASQLGRVMAAIQSKLQGWAHVRASEVKIGSL